MTATGSNQVNLFECAGRLLDVVTAIQIYRFSNPELTPRERSDLESWEKIFSFKALEIGKDVSETILASLQDKIKGIQESTKKVKQALKDLKKVQEVIQALTEVFQFVNRVIQVLKP
jgi:hypothetical protein